jgi:integrase
MRKNEILDLKWSEVDLAGRITTVREGKCDSERHVPVNSALAATLDAIPRRIDSPYVFCHVDQEKSQAGASTS